MSINIRVHGTYIDILHIYVHYTYTQKYKIVNTSMLKKPVTSGIDIKCRNYTMLVFSFGIHFDFKIFYVYTNIYPLFYI